jgi:hypothetical protein
MWQCTKKNFFQIALDAKFKKTALEIQQESTVRTGEYNTITSHCEQNWM